MTLLYDNKYIETIKSFLIEKCFNKYCEVVYTKNDYTIEEYETKLLEYKEDYHVWTQVFSNVSNLLKYYNKIRRPDTNAYSQIYVYTNTTFQEFIDTYFEYNSFDDWDDSHKRYKKYIEAINTSSYEYNKMVEKYNEQTSLIRLKNYIIYVVRLKIMEKTFKSIVFTEEEKSEINQHFNIIPFMEYIGKLNYNVEDLLVDSIESITDDSANYANVIMEKKVFFEILRSVLQ